MRISHRRITGRRLRLISLASVKSGSWQLQRIRVGQATITLGNVFHRTKAVPTI